VSDEAEILRALNAGSSKQVLENKGNSPLSRLLVSMSEDVVERLQQALVDRGINTSSQGLSQSLAVTEIKFEGESLTVGISGEFYWKYINYGVNGTEIHRGAPNWGPAPTGSQSFKQAIGEWIPQRGLQLPPSFSSFESFTYAIMTNIRKFGKEARPFFEDVVNERLVDELRGPVEAVLGRAIEISIVAPWQ
jgi:hypothetical protein